MNETPQDLEKGSYEKDNVGNMWTPGAHTKFTGPSVEYAETSLLLPCVQMCSAVGSDHAVLFDSENTTKCNTRKPRFTVEDK